jgi:hypothetical protein
MKIPAKMRENAIAVQGEFFKASINSGSSSASSGERSDLKFQFQYVDLRGKSKIWMARLRLIWKKPCDCMKNEISVSEMDI